jgi:hypothetical protein
MFVGTITAVLIQNLIVGSSFYRIRTPGGMPMLVSHLSFFAMLTEECCNEPPDGVASAAGWARLPGLLGGKKRSLGRGA